MNLPKKRRTVKASRSVFFSVDKLKQWAIDYNSSAAETTINRDEV